MSQYFYTIVADFPNSAVNVEKFADEIKAQITSPVLEGVTTYPTSFPDPYLAGECEITFASTLSGPQKTTLDSIVALHDGIPYTLHEYTYGDDLETRIRNDYLIAHLTDSADDPNVWGVHDDRYANLVHDHDISDIVGYSVQADDGFELEADPYDAGDIQTTLKPIFIQDLDGDMMPTSDGDYHEEFELDAQGDIQPKL